MSEARILSFPDALRAREPGRPPVLDLDVLKGRQATINIEDCHAALDGVTAYKKLKTKVDEYFHELSVAFPRGRKITILGHREAGHRPIQELLTQRLAPNTGNVVINSRISWIIPEARFFDPKGTLRENAIFFSRIIGIDPRMLIDMFLSAGKLPPKAVNEPFRNFPGWVVKRLGLIVLFYCDFDLHLVSRFQPRSMQMSDEEIAQALELVFGRDYIVTCEDAKAVPDNCNLLYLFYEGVLYEFEDVGQGVEVFDMLPKPAEGPRVEKEEDDEFEEEEEVREEIF